MHDFDRRGFLQRMFAATLVQPAWKSGPPAAYLAELASMMRVAPVPGAVIGALNDRKVSWIAPLGVRTAGTTDAVTASTLFQAASLTKQVTAHTAFALRAENKLDFDKLLIDYLDDLPNPLARTVTIRHVLSHSSGFPNWRSGGPQSPPPDLVPAFTPGSKFQYSGEGFFYLQRILEKVSGVAFGQLVKERVFTPLGMTSSTLVWDPETISRTAQPHNRRGELNKDWDKGARDLHAWAARAGKSLTALRYEDSSAALRDAGRPVLPNNMAPNGAASMITCAEDYAKFLAAAIANPELARQQVAINDVLGWGLGWAIERAAGHTYLWQWGDNGGYKNFVLAEPATGGAIFVFTNGDSGVRVYDRVLTHATGHDHPAMFWL
jgi:CubicO group peptidase (beta-lactamase class C family)